MSKNGIFKIKKTRNLLMNSIRENRQRPSAQNYTPNSRRKGYQKENRAHRKRQDKEYQTQQNAMAEITRNGLSSKGLKLSPKQAFLLLTTLGIAECARVAEAMPRDEAGSVLHGRINSSENEDHATALAPRGQGGSSQGNGGFVRGISSISEVNLREQLPLERDSRRLEPNTGEVWTRSAYAQSPSKLDGKNITLSVECKDELVDEKKYQVVSALRNAGNTTEWPCNVTSPRLKQVSQPLKGVDYSRSRSLAMKHVRGSSF